MAALRKRAGGRYSLDFRWEGRPYIRALGTTNQNEAARLKRDAETQLQRIRSGRSALAAKLLDEGFSIVDVLFGSPAIATRIGDQPDQNPTTLAELATASLEQQAPNVGSDDSEAL